MIITYPEHEKLKALEPKRAAVADFLEWLESEGVVLCTRHEHTQECQDPDYGWLGCGATQGSYERLQTRWAALIGKYLGVDENQLEAEKRQMLGQEPGYKGEF